MGEPQKVTNTDPERLTWAEICARYPDQWVVLIDTRWLDRDSFEFETAVVCGHAKGHDEVLRATRHAREHIMSSGIYFTGRPRPLPRSFPA
jgi:hypothetical protein